MKRGKPISETDDRSVHAFTLAELIAIVAVLAVLALCLLPALARTGPDTRAFQCLNNHRQLARAWRMYADDNNERFVGFIHGTGIMVNHPNAPWVQGWLDWNISTQNTNTALLTDSRFASLARYFGNDARILQCPADQVVSAIQRTRGWKRRVRSVSANMYVGGVNVDTGPIDSSLVVAKKFADLTNPKPAETWIFMDEHPDSINDGAIFAPRLWQWIDNPANYHDGGAGIAYADGGAEIHRWQATALSLPIRFTYTPLITPPNDPDILWLRAHTPRKVGAN